MLKRINLVFCIIIAFIFMSCSAYYYGKVWPENVEKGYKNPILLYSYSIGPKVGNTKRKVKKFSEAMLYKLQSNEYKATTELFKLAEHDFRHNDYQAFEDFTDSICRTKAYDLVLVFNLVSISYGYGSDFDYAIFELSGIDTRTEKKVWEGTCQFNFGLFTNKNLDKLSTKIYQDLKSNSLFVKN